MTALGTLRKVRRASYRAGSILGDVNAAGQALEQHNAAPIVLRAVRKGIWRKVTALLTKGLR